MANFEIALIFIFGLLLGSFLNALIFRFKPEDDFSFLKSIRGRSLCPRCQKQLRWFELIPVFSFVFQKFRCRNCKEKISWQYVVVELLTAVIFAAIAYKFWDYPFLMVFWWFAAFFLILISAIDFYHYLIPNILIKILFLAGLVLLLNNLISGNIYQILNTQYSIFNIPYSILNTDYNYLGYYSYLFPKFGLPLWNYLAGLLSFSSILFIISIVSKEKYMGMGDVWLTAVLGFFLGWPAIILVFILSFLSGALIGIILMIFKEKSFDSALPFGPFIAASALAVALWGEVILKIYFSAAGL